VRERPLALAALLAVALAGAACSRAGPAASQRPPGGAGRPRLGVLAPAAAETLALLGAADAVVAVGDWVRSPPELARLPKLGSYDAPAAERVLELGIDTLVTSASVAGRSERAELERLGVRVVELDTSTFAGTLAAIAAVGELVGRQREAAELVAAIRSRLAAVARRVAGAPRPRVLAVVGREPLFVAGPGSHLDELVTLAGGVNVAADAGSAWALVSLEAMLARRPEVILDCSDNRPGAPRGALPGAWASWPFLPAVAAGRVFQVDPDRLTIPGPRLPEMAEAVARFLHPEIFGAPRAEDFEAPAAGGAR
jgi:iron complex transport system substrate-binding protein